MDDGTSVPGGVPRRRRKQTKAPREFKYHTSGDGGTGVREPRRPTPVVGPQQAENSSEGSAGCR